MNILKLLKLASYAGLSAEIISSKFDEVSIKICTFLVENGFEKFEQKDFDNDYRRTNYIFKNNQPGKGQIVFMDLTQKNDFLFFTLLCDYQKNFNYALGTFKPVTNLNIGYNYNDEFIGKLAEFLKSTLLMKITKIY